MKDIYYSPSYQNSFALAIGINKYLYASPLGFAVNDAEAVADILEKQFDFKKGNIKLLIDEKATRNEIMASFMSFCNEGTSPNDRILVFLLGMV
jgi:hypothetical protein